MDNTFYLEIVTPERNFFEDQVEMVILKTTSGEIGILKNHMPMVASVAIGPLRIKQNGSWKEALLTEGFIRVSPEKTIIMTDTAEWPDEVDINRAKAAKARAEERLQSKLSQIEYMRSQAALARAIERLKISKKK